MYDFDDDNKYPEPEIEKLKGWRLLAVWAGMGLFSIICWVGIILSVSGAYNYFFG